MVCIAFRAVNSASKRLACFAGLAGCCRSSRAAAGRSIGSGPDFEQKRRAPQKRGPKLVSVLVRYSRVPYQNAAMINEAIQMKGDKRNRRKKKTAIVTPPLGSLRKGAHGSRGR